jgi:hypothetical protein
MSQAIYMPDDSELAVPCSWYMYMPHNYNLYGMNPIVYCSSLKYMLWGNLPNNTFRKYTRLTLKCQHLLYFAVNDFATCFDPYLGHPQAYVNT